MLRNGTGEEIVVEVNNVEVSTKCELRRYRAVESVGGEVEDGEIDQVLEVGWDRPGESVGGEV